MESGDGTTVTKTTTIRSQQASSDEASKNIEGLFMSIASIYEQVCQSKYLYCRALDERDWDAFHSMLTSELDIDLSQLGGKVEAVGATSYVNEARLSIGGFDVTQHMVSNLTTSSVGEDVELRCYLHATHIFRNEDGTEESLVLGGSYVDRLTLVDQKWTVRAIKLNVAWTNGDSSLLRRARKRALQARTD
jgi:3-phenylpropionate/cinnamic acid dioxygenase small subunit